MNKTHQQTATMEAIIHNSRPSIRGSKGAGGQTEHDGKARITGLDTLGKKPRVTGLDEVGKKPKVTGLDQIGKPAKVTGLPNSPAMNPEQAATETEIEESNSTSNELPVQTASPSPAPPVSPPTESTPAPAVPAMETAPPPVNETPLDSSLPPVVSAPTVGPLPGTAALPVADGIPQTLDGQQVGESAEAGVAEEEALEEGAEKGKSAEEFSPAEQKAMATQAAEDSASRLLENGNRLAALSEASVHYELPKRLMFRKQKMLKRQIDANYLAKRFISSSVEKGLGLIAYANAAKPRLQVAAEKSKADISATVQEQILATQTNTDILKAQVTADSAGMRKHVNSYYFGTVSTIKANTKAQLQKLETEWTTTQGLLEAQRKRQLEFVDGFHKQGKQNVIDVGNQVGREAYNIGQNRAKALRGQQEYEDGYPKSDGYLDGPYTFNVLEAKAKAAEGVGESYQTSFQDKAVEISQDADKGKPEDIKAAHDTLKTVTDKLREFYNTSVNGIKDQEKTMLGQARNTRNTFLNNIKDAETRTLESLEAQNEQQLTGLRGLEERQRTAVDRNTLNTLAQLDEEIIAATTEIANGIEAFVSSQNGQLVPDPELLAPDLAEKSSQFTETIALITGGFETSVTNVESSITTGGESAITLITTFASNGIANAQKTVDDIQPGFAELKEGSTNTFLKLRQAHLDTALKTFTNARDGLKLGAEKLKEGFTKLQGEMNLGMATMKTNLIKGFRDAMNDPKEGIKPTMYEKEKEEADKVEPRWKKVLKVLAIIIIIIVVIVLSVVTMGAAVPFLVGAGMSVAAATVVVGVVVGAIGGALMTMGMNLVNGRPVMEGVGKAMLIGAIGGAFGGIGGVVASKVVGTGVTVGARILTFSIEGIFDIAGGILGDLAAGDLTWEGVMQGFGTGVGIQLVMSRFMKGAKPDVNLKVDVEAPKTKLGEVNAKVKTKFSAAQQKFGGFMEKLGDAGEAAGKSFRTKVTGKPAKVDLDGLDVPTVKPDLSTPKVEPVKIDPDIKVKPVAEPTVKPVETPTVKPETEVPTGKPEAEVPTVKPETEVPTVKPEADGPAVKPETEAPAVKPEADGDVEVGFGGKKNRTHPDAEADADGVVARRKVKGADGQEHEVKVTKKGEIIRCSTCDEIEGHYKAELDAPENAHLRTELDNIRMEPDPEVKARRAQEVADELESFKRSKGMDEEHGQEGKIKETPPQTSRQKKFQEEIDAKLKSGEIDEDMARKLVEYNQKNPSGTRSVDNAIGEFKAGKELGETGSFRDPSAGQKKLPDVPPHTKQGSEVPVSQKLADVKAKTDAEVKQIEADVRAKSQGDAEYQNKKSESFERRHPEAESRKKFEERFEKRYGKLEDAADKDAYLKKKEDLFGNIREKERITHSQNFDKGEVSRLKGDAFEKNYGDAMGEGWSKPGPIDGTYPDGTTFRRDPDLMNGNHLQELKSGRVSMSDSTMEQILKDASLIQNNGKQVTWVFKEGATDSVLNQLKKYGINYKIL